jgi:hypothetical protein
MKRERKHYKRTGTGEVPDTPTTGFATIGVVLQPAMLSTREDSVE